MTIEEMHYDLKFKLNKVDSQQYKNFLIPEIDWLLNEAQELFVKMVAMPRMYSYLGFEKNQRTIEDIRSLVVNNDCVAVVGNVAVLPANYWYFLSGEVDIVKDGCSSRKARLYIREHDDEFEKSPFDCSSFEWRVVNGTFFEDKIRVYDDGTFVVNTLCLNYISKLKYIHNAFQFPGGLYKLPSGVTLIGTQDCELPQHTHREIVDLAVLIASGQINMPDYQYKLLKLRFNELK